jgi:hypothetical protein
MSTLCFTGMDRAEEAKLKLMFSDVNEWLGGTWHIVPEAQAQVLIVDLESMYGHMTWLKVHNSGKYVIAITTRAESDAEHVLQRPVTVESLVAALSAVHSKPAPADTTIAAPAPRGDERSQRAQSLPQTGSGDVQQQPSVVPQAAQEQSPPVQQEPPPAPAPAPPQMDVQVRRAQGAQERPSPVEPTQPLQPVATPRTTGQMRAREPVLWDYLLPGGLPGPSRLEIDGAPPLIIDPRTDTYIGGQALKPYLPYFDLGTLPPNLWQPLSGADLNAQLAAAHTAQPLARLRWMYSLVQGGGELAPGYDPTAKFRLTKWPKTEREYPRHLRIATTMMQAPGTPAEIAAKSDVALADVNDFINASLDSGFAEPVNAPPTTPDSGPKSGGLFGRFRNPRNG